MSVIDWYFDPISPFAWLAWHAMETRDLIDRIRPRPVLLAGLLQQHGQLGPAEIPSKRRFTYRHARWRAAQRAKLHEIPVLIRDVEDRQALELAIIENVQRADLNPVEEALGYQQLIDEYDYSQADLGQVIGKSRSHVANTLRLLKLPADVQKLVQDGALSAGHARSLVTAADPLAVARKIVAEGLSVRQAEELAQERHEPAESKRAPETKSFDFKSADLKALEQRIEDALGLKVDIRHKANDRGEIRLKYKSLDQLDEISRRLEQG